MSLLVETDPIHSSGDPSLRALYELRDGEVLSDQPPFAVVDRTNPFDWPNPAGRLTRLGQAASHLVIPSGTLADEPGAPDPRNWLGPGRRRLDEWLDEVSPAIERDDLRICIEPDCRGILSDTQSTLNFLRERTDDRMALALHPARLLESSMLGEVEDHLIRIFDTLADRAVIVYLSGIVTGQDESAPVRPIELGSGSLDAGTILEIAREHAPATTRFALIEFNPGSIDRQYSLIHEYDLA
ncbi:MAG: hypothetical protein ACF8PN_17275 [Phycisphaerales bacterium]